jgi:hypothetical protein
LGYNPLQSLLASKVLGALSAKNAATLVSKHFFASIIAGSFHSGLVEVFVLRSRDVPRRGRPVTRGMGHGPPPPLHQW